MCVGMLEGGGGELGCCLYSKLTLKNSSRACPSRPVLFFVTVPHQTKNLACIRLITIVIVIIIITCISYAFDMFPVATLNVC